MYRWLIELPWELSGLIVVLAFVGLALSGLWLTRQFVSHRKLKECHDVAGFTFGIIGVIYAVLLGFTIVEANSRFHEAEQNILHETALITALFRDSALFQEKERTTIRKLLRDYTESVYAEEWQLMEEGLESDKAHSIFNEIWNAYREYTPDADKERIWYSVSIDKLNELSQYRIIRLFHANQSIGALMWTLLFAGGCITVFFMYFFFAESMYVQALMITLLAGTIAFMLFLILSLDSIYLGDVSLHPTELKRAVEQFDQSIGKKI